MRGVSLRWMDEAARARHGRLVETVAPDGVRLFLHRRLVPYFAAHPLRLEVAGFGPLRWLTVADDVMLLPHLAFSLSPPEGG